MDMRRIIVMGIMFFALLSCSGIGDRIKSVVGGVKKDAEEVAGGNDETGGSRFAVVADASSDKYHFDSEYLVDINGVGKRGMVTADQLSDGLTMEYGLDGDGTDDTFRIERDHPNGVRILWLMTRRNVGVNLFMELPHDDMREECFDEYDEPKDGVAMELFFSDANNKKTNAALVSIGRKGECSHTYVFVYDGSNPSHVRLADDFDSGEACVLFPEEGVFYIKDGGSVRKHNFVIGGVR